jgi:penicillin amidase
MRKTLERSVPWSPRRRATIALGAAALLVAAMATSARAAGAAGDRPAARPPTLPAVSTGDGADRVRAVDALPPGESGFVDASGAASLHVADQLSLFANWQYKPLQFQSLGGGIHPGGNPAVAVARDSYGIPRVDAADEPSLFYGVGYAMAEDRLYQMEVFRHVGHGTLASLVGSTGLGTDVLVRRLTEGADARAAEFALLPLADRQKVLGFTDGVNQAIAEANADPAHRAPVEFFVFNDFPIQPWTVDDTLAYEEFAGRFFGVFGFTELLAAQVSAQLVDALGAADAEKAFADLYPDSVPAAPVTIPPQDGTFPRHTGGPVGDGAGSPANRTVAGVPTVRELAPSVRQLADEVAAFRRAQRSLAIPGWGSNAVALSGQRTADGNPVLYGGPQVGFAGPAFFWEVELNDPQRHSRGVMVPGIPVLLIGRNQDAGWTVTSAEDANSDTFVEQLDPTDSTYVHDGVELAVEKHTDTIACTDSAAGGPPCPTEPLQLTVYRSVHGPALVDPDAQHRLFVSQSAADHRFLASFAAWDRAGTQHDVRKFGAALAPIALGFNFLYAGPRGDIGYFHTGRYPIRPSNVDPNLPIPGTGPFDWQGFERYADQPHDINPASGYLVNWNNKPAVDWVSKSTSAASNAPRGWGDESHVVPLLQAAADTHQATFADVAQLPRGVAYVDSRARVLLPTLLATLRDGTDPQLRAIRGYLGRWDGRRDHVAAGGSYDTPAIVFFDRWIEHVLTDTFGPVLGPVFPAYAALACPASPCRYVSVDNLDAPTYKWELNALNALLHNLRSQGRDDFDFLGRAGGARNVLLGAAREAAAELTAAQGPDVAAWTEPAETASFQPSGAVAVPPITPLPNRGSYGQIVEPLS